MKVHWTGVCI